MKKRTKIKTQSNRVTDESINASERKLLTSERHHLSKVRRKITRDFVAERKRLERAVTTATRNLSSFDRRRRKNEEAELARIDRRLGIIAGRLSL